MDHRTRLFVGAFVILCSFRATSSLLDSRPPSTSSPGFSSSHRHYTIRRYQQQPDEKISGYEDSGLASKGIVSALTNFFNSIQPVEASVDTGSIERPVSPQELLARIRDDYTVKNYLWTGDIDLGAFNPACRFTDPTLSFTGTDTFVKNIQNLRPIVEALTQTKDKSEKNCRSDLLDIELCEGFVQTRWNMVGELKALPWKPRIDVIGRTKFWFDDKDYRVYFYDEQWEIPAGKALLQLITPAGTIPNSSVVEPVE